MTQARQPRRTREQWDDLIAKQQASELTVEDFCKQHGITASNYYAWKGKLKRETTESNKAQSQVEDWFPVDLSLPKASLADWDIELDLPGGITLRMKTP